MKVKQLQSILAGANPDGDVDLVFLGDIPPSDRTWTEVHVRAVKVFGDREGMGDCVLELFIPATEEEHAEMMRLAVGR